MEIRLERWSLEDRGRLARICSEADRRYLTNRLPDPYTEEDAEWWLNMVQDHEGVDGVFRAIVADGVYVGNISVEQKEDVYCKDAEIGYLLLSNEWSKGITTSAVGQICSIAYSELDIERITGLVYKPNIASQRVLEKNGFVLEGVMKTAVFKNRELYDLCIYGNYR